MRRLPASEPVGLRDRKKARTRATIQSEALRLFREQGYTATTVEQIAEAAEVSPSTFFRYFPTKEDTVLEDDYDPQFVAAFKAQPAGLRPLPAFRRALREIMAEISPGELSDALERNALIQAVPELRARMLDQYARMLDLFAGAIAERAGRPPDDFAARTLAGALIGVMWAVVLAPPGAREALSRVDEALALLEAGLPV